MSKVFYANLKIYRYNEIFDTCQRRDNSLRPSVVPNRETLNKQLQDVKPLQDQIDRENAAAAARARIAEEAAREYLQKQQDELQQARDAEARQPPAVQPTQAPSPQNTGDIYQYCKAEFMKIWPRGEFCYTGYPQDCGIAGYRECVRGDPNWRQSVQYQ